MYNFKGFTNSKCEFYPCHKGVTRQFNCLYCYCPLMQLECPGPYKVFTSKYGKATKDCSNCTLPHDGIEQSWGFIQRWLPVAPPWDGKEQSEEKIRTFSTLVRRQFDPTDIEWAKTNVDNQ